MEIELIWILVLALAGFIAGFVDSIAGGGGMVTVPALMLAGLPPHLALGTNKGQSVFGSGVALYRYSRSHLFDPDRAKKSILPALVGAGVGVLALTAFPQDWLTPLIAILLIIVAATMIIWRGPRPGASRVQRSVLAVAAVAFVIAAYDGFFGPGTGTFLIIAYALWWRDPMDAASANAKVVNFCSNAASLAVFTAMGLVYWPVALPMGICQALGALLGARTVIKGGRNIVRYTAILVSILLLVRLLTSD